MSLVSIQSGSLESVGVTTPPGWIGKLLKIPVFRLSLGDDLVSRVVIAVYNFFCRLIGNRGTRSFESTIAEQSVDRFLSLGAQIDFVTPRDGRGRIQMMSFRAQDLDQKIRDLGGSWERKIIGENEVFAIVPPLKMEREWIEFREKINHFRWDEVDGMLITSECASEIPEHAPTQCFLYSHSTSLSFASQWK